MTAFIAPDRHRVSQHCAARWSVEGRLKHQRPFKIAAAYLARIGRADGPVSSLLVQQPGKDRWPIETGKAQPIDGTCAADQRG